MKEVKPDNIARPAHYTEGRMIEPLTIIEDWNLTYHEGNILKYLSRWSRKGGVEDLRKAEYFLQRLIELNS